MKNKLLLSAITLSCICAYAHAWNNSDITCAKNDYTDALTACKSNCNSACLNQVRENGGRNCQYMITSDVGTLCNCIANGYSADNCAYLIRILCLDDDRAAATIGSTELWYERTYNSGTNTCTSTQKTYCAAGYYGTATGVNAGCSTCPSNATCPGSSEQANVYCNKGYVAVSTSSVGSGCRTCAVANAYLDSGLTTAAVATTAGLTLLSQATDAASCYLPVGTYYDSMGQFTITQDLACYY